MEPLKPFEKIAEPDGRWELLNVSFIRLHGIAESMSLNKNVPEYARVQFQQAQHLLVYSYYQFSLLSVAQIQAFIALECALRIRWQSEFPERAKQLKRLPALKTLLQLAGERNWVMGCTPAFIEHVRSLRNNHAHGEYILHPTHAIEMIELCGTMIQQLYPTSA